MRIAVIGATGLLGGEICRQHVDARPLSRPGVDIARPASILPALRIAEPDAVINCAAFTHVDMAESEPVRCHAINAEGVRHLADACRELGCTLVQMSTDYVFGGDARRATPYFETDETAPLGVYGKSKLAGEEYARRCDRHLIVRTCGLYGQSGSGTAKANFVDTMLRLGRERGQVRVINDQVSSPSFVAHVARAVLRLVEQGASGTFHVVNDGAISWFELAQATFHQAGLSVKVVPISTAEFGAPAPRPAYSVLDTHKYASLFGSPLPCWDEALAEYLSTIRQIK